MRNLHQITLRTTAIGSISCVQLSTNERLVHACIFRGLTGYPVQLDAFVGFNPDRIWALILGFT